MKWLALGLLLLLLLAQYRLWFADEGSLAEHHRLEQEIARQQLLNESLRARNEQLEQEVLELQQGLATVEERARKDLGMIREGETYYQVVEEEESRGDSSSRSAEGSSSRTAEGSSSRTAEGSHDR
ncbi:MAG: cell division protein FtsB [Halieaceae bacterium]